MSKIALDREITDREVYQIEIKRTAPSGVITTIPYNLTRYGNRPDLTILDNQDPSVCETEVMTWLGPKLKGYQLDGEPKQLTTSEYSQLCLAATIELFRTKHRRIEISGRPPSKGEEIQPSYFTDLLIGTQIRTETDILTEYLSGPNATKPISGEDVILKYLEIERQLYGPKSEPIQEAKVLDMLEIGNSFQPEMLSSNPEMVRKIKSAVDAMIIAERKLRNIGEGSASGGALITLSSMHIVSICREVIQEAIKPQSLLQRLRKWITGRLIKASNPEIV